MTNQRETPAKNYEVLTRKTKTFERSDRNNDPKTWLRTLCSLMKLFPLIPLVLEGKIISAACFPSLSYLPLWIQNACSALPKHASNSKRAVSAPFTRLPWKILPRQKAGRQPAPPSSGGRAAFARPSRFCVLPGPWKVPPLQPASPGPHPLGQFFPHWQSHLQKAALGL